MAEAERNQGSSTDSDYGDHHERMHVALKQPPRRAPPSPPPSPPPPPPPPLRPTPPLPPPSAARPPISTSHSPPGTAAFPSSSRANLHTLQHLAVETSTQHASAPPLPPKPSFARAAPVPPRQSANQQRTTAPPLPPKPAAARAPRLSDLTPVRPTRPAPLPPALVAGQVVNGQNNGTPPRKSGNDGSRDVPQFRRPSVSTREDVTSPTSSSTTVQVPTGFGQEHDYPTMPVPFPAPACVLRESGLSKLFARSRSESRNFAASANAPSPGLQSFAVMLPRSTTFHAKSGAAAIATKRRQRSPQTSSMVYADGRWKENCVVPCKFYSGSRMPESTRAVIDQIVGGYPVGTRRWKHSVEVLVGIVVNSCLEDAESGTLLLNEIARKMRRGDASMRAAIFVLLFNVGIHAAFAGSAWRLVERIVLCVFSNVVENMDVCLIEEHDAAWRLRGSDETIDVEEENQGVWDNALKCFFALVAGGSRIGNLATNDIEKKTGRSLGRQSRSGSGISVGAMVALAKHVSPKTHPCVERILVGDGLWRGFRGNFEEDDDAIRFNVDENLLYSQYGGIDAILEVYTRVRSLTARRRLFALILEVAVSRVHKRGGGPRSAGFATEVNSEEQANWLFGLLRSYDAGDAMVAIFRLGPKQTFVMDTLRHMLFEPLAANSNGSAVLNAVGLGTSSRGDEGLRSSIFPQDSSVTGHSLVEMKVWAAANDHRRSVIAANRAMYKPFVIGVLMELESMALAFQKSPRRFAARPSDDLVREIEAKVSTLKYEGLSNSLRSVRQVWQTLYSSVSKLAHRAADENEIIMIIDSVLSIALVPGAYRNMLSESADTESEALLSGERRVLAHGLCVEGTKTLVQLIHLANLEDGSRYLSEQRQCLVELLGFSEDQGQLVRQFRDDPDPMVAHRAAAISATINSADGRQSVQ